jgi:hypothetical protein
MSIRRAAVRPVAGREAVPMLKSSKIKPFLWFDTQAEEATR